MKIRRACIRSPLLPAILGWIAMVPPLALGATLVPAGSVWKYLDDGSNQGTEWRFPTFDDSGWAAGPAQLGYGDGDEKTVVDSGSGPEGRHITTYFRHSWTVSDPQLYASLALRLLRDDGAVVYLNGVEVARLGMIPMQVDFLTPAAESHEEESLFVGPPLNIPPGLLVPGMNVLAVEVHQVSRMSSDVSFDLELADEPGTLTSLLDLPADAAFVAPAHLALTAKAASRSGVTRMEFLINDSKQGERTMLNSLYGSFAATLEAPTSYSLALTAYDNQGGTDTSTVDVVVEPAPDPARVGTLVPGRAHWRFLDDGSDQGTSWQSPGYTHEAWPDGPAPLGYGRSGISTPVQSERTDGAPIVTTYFRHTWAVPDPSLFSKLMLSVQADDGVKVYLNGHDVFRNNLPSDPVVAATAALEPADPTEFLSSPYIDASLLVAGPNVLAAEVHQVSSGVRDLIFDVELTGLSPLPPSLSIEPTDTGNVLLSWPCRLSGFQLMESPSLSSPNWTAVTSPISQVGDANQVVLPPAERARFYQLQSDEP